MKRSKLLLAVIALIGLMASYAVMASGSWVKYVKIGGTPRSPYITYAIYVCHYDNTATAVCDFHGTTVGINPDL